MALFCAAIAATSWGTVKTTWEGLDVEEVRCAVGDPGRAFQRLPRGTMPIRAGVIGDALVSTRSALFDRAAERGGATRLDRGHHAPLRR